MVQRIYNMSVMPIDDGMNPLLHLLGWHREKTLTWQDFELNLAKALSGEYQSVLFGECGIEWEYFEEAVRLCFEVGVKVRVMFTPLGLLSVKSKALSHITQCGGQIELLAVEGQESSIPSILKYFEGGEFLVNLLMTPRLQVNAVLKVLENKASDIFFYFPIPQDGFKLFGISEVADLKAKIETQYKKIKVKSRPGLDIFDPRIPKTMCLEPIIDPKIECKVAQQTSDALEVSVIIPTYNNKVYLTVVVDHLVKQSLDKSRYEIVVVDDGSSDGTAQFFSELSVSLQGLVNLKYIQFPRIGDRKMGDGEFRAGIARNLGVKNSKGKIYTFLDSDIVVPNDFLENLILQHQSSGVVQGKRLELTKENSHSQVLYEKIDPDLHTYVVDGGYWLNFINSTLPWNQVENGWKYVCSHSLSVRADLFKKAGWFRKTFCFYGNEDTELGYRLWQMGTKFSRNNQFVYHLYHADTRSEFQNSHLRKLKLLRKTAYTFYFNNLSPEVYQSLKYLFDDLLSLKVLGKRFSEKYFRPLFPIYWSILAVAIFPARLASCILEWLKSKNESGAILSMESRNKSFFGISKPFRTIRFFYSDSKSKQDWLEDVDEATNGLYEGILFSSNLLKNGDLEEALGLANSKLSYVGVRVSANVLLEDLGRVLLEKLVQRYHIHLLVSSVQEGTMLAVNRFLGFENSLAVICLNQWSGSLGIVRSIESKWRDKVYFNSEPNYDWKPGRLTWGEVESRKNRIESSFPGFQVFPEPGLVTGQKNLRNFRYLNFEESAEAVFEGQANRFDIDLSVIVYCRSIDSLTELLDRVEGVLESYLKVEFVVVMSGLASDDRENLLEVGKGRFSQKPVKILNWFERFKRPITACSSDREICYFVGAEEAQGQIYCFVDDSALFDLGYLEGVLKYHQANDFNQSQIVFDGGEIANSNKESFASKSESWGKIRDIGFSVSRELYYLSGGVRPEYVGSGIAVKEFAYRVFQRSIRFSSSGVLICTALSGRDKNEKAGVRDLATFYSETLDSEVARLYTCQANVFAVNNWITTKLGQKYLERVGQFVRLVFNAFDEFYYCWRWASDDSNPPFWPTLRRYFFVSLIPQHLVGFIRARVNQVKKSRFGQAFGEMDQIEDVKVKMGKMLSSLNRDFFEKGGYLFKRDSGLPKLADEKSLIKELSPASVLEEPVDGVKDVDSGRPM